MLSREVFSIASLLISFCGIFVDVTGLPGSRICGTGVVIGNSYCFTQVVSSETMTADANRAESLVSFSMRNCFHSCRSSIVLLGGRVADVYGSSQGSAQKWGSRKSQAIAW